MTVQTDETKMTLQERLRKRAIGSSDVRFEAYQALLSAALAREAECREALKPFAAVAQRYAQSNMSTMTDSFWVYVELGGCRKANTLLSTPSPSTEAAAAKERVMEARPVSNAEKAAHDAGWKTAQAFARSKHDFTLEYKTMAVIQDALRAYDAARREK